MITQNNNDDFAIYVRLTLTKFTQVWEQLQEYGIKSVFPQWKEVQGNLISTFSMNL
jgi:hypothetical protein